MAKTARLTGVLLTAAAIFTAACRSGTGGAPEGLVVVNAPATGRISRVLVSEGARVQNGASLIEITLPPKIPAPANAENRQSRPAADPQAEMRAAEENLDRAAAELQRIEPLVAAGSAPQSHLDAARAEYQQAQERLDGLRRGVGNAPPVSREGRSDAGESGGAARENTVSVAAPAAGSVRVVSVRVGQTVKAGDPVATISTKYR